MSNLQKNPEDIDSLGHPQSPLSDSRTITRMHPSLKRPRAPIACYRCHHKKVRCDGAHPNCTRCLSTGVLCAYPNSRRSRNTQPTNVDPFINNLSHLEARIRRIETDLESQRAIMHSVFSPKNDNECSMGRRFKETLSLDSTQMNLSQQHSLIAGELNAQMLKTEQEVQESRSILAQLRLRGEQKIARGKRAAAAAVSTTSSNLGQSALASTAQTASQTASTPSSGSSSKETGRARSVHSSAASRQKLNKSQQAIEKQKKNAALTGSVSPSYNVPPCNISTPMDTHYPVHSLHPSSALSSSNACAYNNNPMLAKNEYMDTHQFCVEASSTMVDWSLLQRTSSTEESTAGTSGMFLMQHNENTLLAQQQHQQSAAAQLADIHKQHNGILSPTPSSAYRSPNGSMSNNDNSRSFTMSNSPFIQPLNISFNLAPSSSSSSTTTDSTVSSSVQTSQVPQQLGNDSCNMFNLSTFMIDDMLTEESHGIQSSMLSNSPSVWYC
ncbi:hypothetical protein CLU79DRAFT_834108 [Phycomyces nitens]|nr:hypothetical protein CLU79DRAFT_834108 [Phycomyces nitens]